MSANELSSSANKAFYVLLAVFIIALAGLTTFLVKSIPLTIAHVVYVCQKNISNIAVTLPHSIPFSVMLLALIVLIIGFLVLGFQIIKTRLYIKRNIGKRILAPIAMSKALLRIKILSDELNLDGRIDIVKDKNQFSFCYGIIKPRICLSTGLIKRLDQNELRAVISHESYHLKNYDPLKIIVGKAAALMFFFIPTMRDVLKYYAFSKELAADGEALKNGLKQPLLSALSKLITTSTPKFSGVAALGSDDLEKRIKYLTNQHQKMLFRPSILSLSLSTFVILLSLIILNAPVHAFTMDEQSMEHSYFLCPYGDNCATECKNSLKDKEINFSENEHSSSTNRLYTPKDASK